MTLSPAAEDGSLSCRLQQPGSTCWLNTTSFQIGAEVAALAVIAPGHPGSDAVGIPDDALGAIDRHADIVGQKLAALDVASVCRPGGASVVTPPPAVDLEDAVVS